MNILYSVGVCTDEVEAYRGAVYTGLLHSMIAIIGEMAKHACLKL